MWGKLRNPRWRYWVEVLGFGCCLYSSYVGWLFAVLDPLALMSLGADAAALGIWVEAVPLIDLRPELPAIEPYLIAICIAEFGWIALGGSCPWEQKHRIRGASRANDGWTNQHPSG